MAAEWMRCPTCSGTGQDMLCCDCLTCAGDGVVPGWLADPDVVGEYAAREWGWSG